MLRFKGEKLTVVVFPGGNSRVRKITLSPKGLQYVSCGALILGVVTTAAYLFSALYVVQFPESRRTRLENVTLRTQLNTLTGKMDEIEASLARIKRFDKKLRLITKVNDPARNIAMGPVSMTRDASATESSDFSVDDDELGVEGQSSLGLTVTHQFPELSRHDSFTVKRLYLKMKQIYSEAFLEEQSIQELTELMRDQQSRLAATPAIWPVAGWPTSGYGYRRSPYTGLLQLHEGIDIAARLGSAIRAPADGEVIFAGIRSGYGNTLVINHGYGISSFYGHCARVMMKAGDKIRRGDIIAEVGNTGRSTGPHVHYEVRLYGMPVDPANYILE